MIFDLLICFFIRLSLNMDTCIRDHWDQPVIAVKVIIMNVLMIQIFKKIGHKFDKLWLKHSVRYSLEKEDSSFGMLFRIGFEGDVTLLDQQVHLHRLPDRYTLVKEGEQLNKLFFVIKGSIVGYMKEITGAKKERKTSELRGNIQFFSSSSSRCYVC